MTRKCHVRFGGGSSEKARQRDLAGGLPTHELVHQTWHHDAHDPVIDRQQFEFEAESVSFVVAAIMGLEHPGARDYLLSYRVSPEQLKRCLAVIQLEVRHLLKVLELPFAVMDQPEAMTA